MSKSVKRLYEQFRPENYQLRIDIDPEKMTFSGQVVISGQKSGRPSQRLTFHQKGLKITNAEITSFGKKGEQKIELARINQHDGYDEIRLHSLGLLYPGLYKVRMDFSGKITKAMVGLYPSFFEHEGTTKIIFATQFESHHAREVFPCIDEPEAKATFDLTLKTPTGQQVLANTLPSSQTKQDDFLVTSFETTPVMSTYLLAFACGDLHSVEAKTKSGVLLRSWASLAQPKQNLQFSLDEGIKVLEFYEDYFGTKFPLKKLDQLALPDFDSGAMENWGLITYREVAMLTDPTNRSIPSEQYVALVIAHELSHQWFGNLVTMKWWDDLWLNESFASLIEHICLDALHPDWHQWEHYTSSDVITASNRDIYSDVQPVGVSVKHPDEIITLFDPAIVYAKGGRLLKMMREFIGEEAFKAALKSYFKIHAYKNTTREDLWAEMSKASGQNIAELMTPWLTQSGMPILKVEATDNDNQRLISQSRFVLDNVSDSQLWPVPLLVSGQVKPNIIDKESAVIELASDTPPIFNSSGSGHYVVHYAEASDHKAILAQVKQRTANTEARINILNDLLLLARRGDNSLVDALQVIEHMNDEPRDAVWALMARGIGLASGIGEFNQLLDSGLKKLRVQLASKHFQRLGWDDTPTEDLNTISLRSTILSLMLSGEDETTIADALSRYRSIKNIEAIPADRRGHLLGAAVRHSDDPAVIDQLIAKYQETPDADLQISIGSALCATKSSEVVNRLLAEAMGPDGFVRSQDLFRWFAYLMRNKYSREQAWQWLVNSWDRIAEESGGAKSLEYYIWYAAAPIQTEEWFSKFKAMFEPKKKIVVLERNILVAEAEITARIKWHNREISKLENYVKSVQ